MIYGAFEAYCFNPSYIFIGLTLMRDGRLLLKAGEFSDSASYKKMENTLLSSYLTVKSTAGD